MITNDIKRIRDKLNVLKNHPEVWGVITDCLKLFDDNVTERNTADSNRYVYWIEELKSKYEEEILQFEEKFGSKQQKLFDNENGNRPDMGPAAESS